MLRLCPILEERILWYMYLFIIDLSYILNLNEQWGPKTQNIPVSTHHPACILQNCSPCSLPSTQEARVIWPAVPPPLNPIMIQPPKLSSDFSRFRHCHGHCPRASPCCFTLDGPRTFHSVSLLPVWLPR